MTGVVALRPGAALASYEAKQLDLIRRTVAADCTPDEFNMFIGMARSLRLDPLRRQIFAFVYNKDKPNKRRMSIIVAIDGFRTIAERTGNYRPDEDEPNYEIDTTLRSALNPIGLVKATVRVWKHSHGGWHKVTASAYWDEYAPIKDEWSEGDDGRRRPTGKQVLDNSGNWAKMPRLMLAKVAEALALRKAWPDDFSNVYAPEEVDHSKALDLMPSELAHQGGVETRLERIGGPGLTIDWNDGQALDHVPVGQFFDRAEAFLRECADEPMTVRAWADRNRVALKEFWAQAPGDALELRKRIEAATAVCP